MQGEKREQLVEWFTQMKEIEKSARDMYLGAAENPELDQETKKAFLEISEDEDRHIQIVQNIVNIASTCL